MMAYIRRVFLTVVHTKLFLIALILSIAPHAVAFAFDPAVYGPLTIDAQIANSLSIQKNNIESGAYDRAPSDLKDVVELRIQYLEAAVHADSSQEGFRYAGKFYELMLQGVEMGYVAGEETLLDVNRRYCAALSELPEVNQFDSVSEMPALYYYSWYVGSFPALIQIVPVLLLSRCLSDVVQGSSLFRRAPLSGRKKAISLLIVGAMLFVLSVVVVNVSVAVLVVLQNGMGYLDYPVIYLQNGAIQSATAGGTLLHETMLATALQVTVFVVSVSLSTLAGNKSLGIVVPVVFLAIPQLPWYLNNAAALGGVYSKLPITYCLIGNVSGYVGVFPGIDLFPAAGLHFDYGIASVLLIACLFASFLIIPVTKRPMLLNAR